jgi:3'-phosphoadenosine 5'-phosphosulfate sulfotransferase
MFRPIQTVELIDHQWYQVISIQKYEDNGLYVSEKWFAYGQFIEGNFIDKFGDTIPNVRFVFQKYNHKSQLS